MSTEYIRYPSNIGGPSGPITIGQPVIGGLPNNILTVDFAGNLSQVSNILSLLVGVPTEVFYSNNSTGAVTQDANFTRDSSTGQTHIAKQLANVISELLIGDPGFGVDTAVLHRINNNNNEQGFFGLVDGAVFGNPYSVVGVLEVDDGANQQVLSTYAPNVIQHNWNDNSSAESASLILGAATGAVLTYTNPSNTRTLSFVSDSAGIGWAIAGAGAFFLPTTPPTAGQVVGSIAGGYGQLDWITPGGGGGGVTSLNTLTGAVVLSAGTNITLTPVGNTITIDAANSPYSGTPTEVLYLNALGAITSDSDFARINLTGQTKMVSQNITAGYDTGVRFGTAYSAPNSVVLEHYDNINNVGSKQTLGTTGLTLQTSDLSVPTIQLSAIFSTSLSGLPNTSLGIVDSGTVNKSSGLIATLGSMQGQFNYNLSGGFGNRWVIDPTTFQIISDLPVPAFRALDFNFSTQTYVYGDSSNLINGFACGLNIPAKFWATGDIGLVGNGQNIACDDINRYSVMGDSQNIKNGTAIAAADGNQTIIGQTKYSGTAKPILFASGVDYTQVLLGHGALGNLSGGTRNTAVGVESGRMMGNGNDSTFVGYQSGYTATVQAIDSRNTFIGSLSGPAGATGTDNSGIGYQAKAGNNVTGSLSLGSGAQTWQSNMVSFGGDGSTQKQTLYNFYRGVASANAGQDNILFKKTNASGTDQDTGMWNFETGDSTGNKDGGPFVFYVALRETGGSGSGTYANIAQQNEIVRFNPEEVYFSKKTKYTFIPTLTAANDLVSGDSNYSVVNGNTTINGFDANWSGCGDIKFIFKGTLTLKNNTTPSAGFRKLRLAGSIDASVVPNATFTFMYDPIDDVFQETARTYP